MSYSTANAFALMGLLRRLYFLIGGLLDRLVYLSYGLSLILAFINGGQHVAVPVISTGASIGVIGVVLVITTVASLVKTRGQKPSEQTTHPTG